MIILYSIIICLNVGLGFLALFKNNNQKGLVQTRAAFFNLSCFCALWVLSVCMVKYGASPIFWIKMAFFSGIGFVFSFLLMILRYPTHINLPKWVWGLVIGGAVLLCGLSFTPLIVQGFDASAHQVNYGPLYRVVVYYISALILTSGFLAIHQYRKGSGLDRLRVFYLISGMLFSFVGIYITNILLPNLLHTNKSSAYGPLFLTVFLATTVYSILKHRLMEIDLVIKKGVFYFLLTTCLSLPVLFLFMVTSILTADESGLTLFFCFGFVAISIVLLYPHLIEIIDHITERLFFRKPTDYQALTTDISGRLSRVITETQLADVLVRVMTDRLKLYGASLYVLRGTGAFSRVEGVGSMKNIPEVLPEDHPVIQWFKYRPCSVYPNEPVFDVSDIPQKELFTQEMSFFMVNGVGVGIPFMYEGRLMGFLLLTEKLSQKAFTQNDTLFFEMVSNQAVTVLQNMVSIAEVKQQISTLNDLNAFAVRVSETLESDAIFEVFSTDAKKFLGFDWVICSDSTKLLGDESGASWFDRDSDSKKIKPFPCSAYKEYVLQLDSEYGPFVLSSDMHPELTKYKDYLTEQLGNHRVIGIPFLHSGKLMGIALGGLSNVRSELSPRKMMMLGTLAQQTAVALYNAHLYEEMRQMQSYHEAILGNMTSGVVVLDDQNCVALVNQAFATSISMQREAMVHVSIDDLIKKNRALIALTENRGPRQPVEIILKNETGMHDYSLSVEEIPFGEVVYRVGVLSDLTSIKKLQKQMIHADRLSSLGTMAAGIAHEIRNPLSAVLLCTEMLQTKWEDNGFTKTYVDTVDTQVTRINTLCQSLLRLGKPQKPRLDEVSLRQVFQEMEDLLGVKFREKSVSFESRVTQECSVYADRNQLVQVLINIILNALDAVPDTGGVIWFSYESSGEIAVIRIHDNGKGIPSDDISKVFDPFFTNKEQGTGLGLSIVHQIIQDHRGTISVQSSPDQGTEFVISIPLFAIRRVPKELMV
ncbi:hypothetical protein HOH87_03950 [bacterium]|jgi:signal transduction histidine kinase|nr:hypothetical protein [bacterium]